MTRDLELTFDLAHPPEKVWRALTEPELLARWLMKTDLAPTVGEAFQFRMGPTEGWDGVIDCEMREVDPPRALSYTWRSLGVDTVVRWTLERTADGTRLTLVQSGFAPDQKQAYGGAKGGWNHMAGDKLPGVLAELD